MEGFSNILRMIIGVSFISLMINNLLPSSSYQKYVRGILGILISLFIIKGFVGMKDLKLDLSSIEKFDYANKQVVYDNRKQELYKEKIVEKIKNRLIAQKIEHFGIDVTVDENFYVKKIIVTTNYNPEEIKRMVSEETGLKKSITEVQKRGK